MKTLNQYEYPVYFGPQGAAELKAQMRRRYTPDAVASQRGSPAAESYAWYFHGWLRGLASVGAIDGESELEVEFFIDLHGFTMTQAQYDNLLLEIKLDTMPPYGF